MVGGLTGRRAAIQIQINWIFALVAGVLILLVVTGFIWRSSSSQEDRVSARVSLQLQTIMASAQSARGTANNITVPGEITFDCSGYQYGRVPNTYGSNLIFPTGTIRDRMVAYTQELSLPFRAANLLYLTDPRVRYIFRSTPSLTLTQDLFDLMPAGANAELFVSGTDDPSSIRDNRHERVRIIVHTTLQPNQGAYFPNLALSMAARDSEGLDLVVVNQPNSAIPDLFQVGFYTLDSGGGGFTRQSRIDVLGIESVMGAIFAEDFELFDCTMDRVMERYDAVTDVHLRRTRKLTTGPFPASCITRYTTAGDALDKIRIALQSYPGPVMPIAQQIAQLELINNQLKLYSCPSIY